MACPLTCGKAETRRRRGCNEGKHGGDYCPDRKKNPKLYTEHKDCVLPPCPGKTKRSFRESTFLKA